MENAKLIRYKAFRLALISENTREYILLPDGSQMFTKCVHGITINRLISLGYYYSLWVLFYSHR